MPAAMSVNTNLTDIVKPGVRSPFSTTANKVAVAAAAGLPAVRDLMIQNEESPEYTCWCSDSIANLCSDDGALT